VLNENDVINYVCNKLCCLGYTILQKCYTKQRGVDIIAEKERTLVRKLYIEAKGETSSKPYSERYGKIFDGADFKTNVGETLYDISEILSKEYSKNIELQVGIALPYNPKYCELIERIKPILDRLEIAVFWVESTGNVQISSVWEV